ncbi:hypothetical protein BKA70DRAFT_1323349 [Coprinopsis sp. MPI-PUGE-AT-0042]|nr:hypothetical protein BKA70DRAFT_1323349 [Coprinopsis sp. MPI-PUGE-AT-0042]
MLRAAAGCLTDRFDGLARYLEDVSYQVEPHSGDILSEVHCILSDLNVLVGVASTIYDDLGTGPLGNHLQRMLDTRVMCCTGTLSKVFRKLDRLAYRRLPLLGFIYHRVFGRWWDTWEPQDIVTIREGLSEEVDSFARYLSGVKLFCHRARPLLVLNPKTRLEWSALDYLWKKRHTMGKEIRIERIIIVEPLGDHLVVPLRFVNSFEDVHMIISLACQGSKGSRYIEGRRYELDDAHTNEAVAEENFQALVGDGKLFEVTILIQGQSAELATCPRCGEQDEHGGKEGDWIRCVSCHTQFARHISNIPTSRIDEVDDSDSYEQSEISKSNDPEGAMIGLDNREPTHEDALEPFIFRRMKIEMLCPQEAQQSHPTPGLVFDGLGMISLEDRDVGPPTGVLYNIHNSRMTDTGSASGVNFGQIPQVLQEDGLKHPQLAATPLSASFESPRTPLTRGVSIVDGALESLKRRFRRNPRNKDLSGMQVLQRAVPLVDARGMATGSSVEALLKS